MTEQFISITNLEEWAEFWADNREALAEEIGDESTCRELAISQSLMIGGGAAPLFRVGMEAC